MKKKTKRWKAGAAALLAAALLCGCSSDVPLLSSARGEKEYGKPETMVIVMTERHRYEDLYSDQIWSAAVDNRGTTFDASLADQIHDFMQELKIMSMMAGEEGVSLSAGEKEAAAEAAGTYMEELGSQLAKELEISQETVQNLYSDYCLAEKLVEKLTGSMDLEVSDSEAKVIAVSQIVLEDETRAQEVLASVQQEGADFYSIAQENSVDPEIKKQIFRGLMGSSYEEAAYSLETGQISDVVEENGKYYILKCENDYDEAATMARKEEMVKEKKNQAFYQAYQTFREGITLTEDPELWSGLSVSGSPATEADFFEILQKIRQPEETEAETA